MQVEAQQCFGIGVGFQNLLQGDNRGVALQTGLHRLAGPPAVAFGDAQYLLQVGEFQLLVAVEVCEESLPLDRGYFQSFPSALQGEVVDALPYLA